MPSVTSPTSCGMVVLDELQTNFMSPSGVLYLQPAPSTIASLGRALHCKTVLLLGCGGLENLLRFGQHVGDQLGGDTMVLEVEEAHFSTGLVDFERDLLLV